MEQIIWYYEKCTVEKLNHPSLKIVTQLHLKDAIIIIFHRTVLKHLLFGHVLKFSLLFSNKTEYNMSPHFEL